MKLTERQTRVCYWPLGCTVSDLNKDVLKARQKERMLLVQFPQDTDATAQGYMWSFKTNTRMARAGHSIESEITIEYRSARERNEAKYHNQTTSLNQEPNLLTRKGG